MSDHEPVSLRFGPRVTAATVFSRPEMLILAVFIASRVAYYICGIRFDASPISQHWQFIDPVLMRDDLFRSLLYLHMQPPGMNLLIGLLVKFLPHSYAAALQGIGWCMGLVVALLLFRLMQAFAVAPRVAIFLTCLFVITPGTVLFENAATYDYPTLLLLLLAAVSLFRLAQSPSVGTSLGFFATLFVLISIRNQFHLFYLLLVSLGLFFLMPAARHAIALGSLSALAATLAIYVKNWFLFGAFAASTQAGMLMAVCTTHQLTPAEVDLLVARGTVSSLARIPPLGKLTDYDPFIQRPAKTGIPVLDQEVTSTGHTNFNHLGYIEVHRRYMVDATAVLRHYHRAYLRSCLIAWFAYFLPAGDVHYFDEARAPIRRFDRLFSAVVFGKFFAADSRKDLRALLAAGRGAWLVLYTGVTLLLLLPALFTWGVVALARSSLRARMSRPQILTLGFALFTIAWVTALSNLLSTYENNRYRFPLDGYYIVLLGMACTWLWGSRSRRDI